MIGESDFGRAASWNSGLAWIFAADQLAQRGERVALAGGLKVVLDELGVPAGGRAPVDEARRGERLAGLGHLVAGQHVGDDIVHW